MLVIIQQATLPMMRTAIILLSLLGILSAENTDHWRAWLASGTTAILIDENGTELNRMSLPVEEGQFIVDMEASHNGKFIAYISTNGAFDSAQVRVIDSQTKRLSITHDLPGEGSFLWSGVLRASGNFSLDDTAFAVAEYGESPEEWRILVFDLVTGEVTHILNGDTFNKSMMRMEGNKVLIYRFANDIISFAPITVWNTPLGPESAFRWSVDWHLDTGTFSENCAYTHIDHDTLEPSGLAIESAFHIDLGYVPDADVETTPYGLEFYDVDTHWRQVFYRSSEFLPRNPTFVQNGEKVAFWGHPETEKPGFERLTIIDHDGSTVDQIDVLGQPTIRGTNAGFLYTTFYDVSGWVGKVYYVNTHDETPFAHQSVIWEGQPDKLVRLVWAGNESISPNTDFMPWADYMSFDPGCPPFRG